MSDALHHKKKLLKMKLVPYAYLVLSVLSTDAGLALKQKASNLNEILLPMICIHCVGISK